MVNVGHQSNGRQDVPTHHISLKEHDNSNETGFICVGDDGIILPDVEVRPYPGQATQFSQGRSKHADKRKPFIDVALDDFVGGGQMLHHDEDASRYLDGYMINTSLENRVMLQGKPKYTKGLRDFNENIPDGDETMSWQALISGATIEVESADFTIDALDDTSWALTTGRVYLRKIGSPDGSVAVSVKLASDDSVISYDTITADDLPAHSPYWVEADFNGAALTHGADYYLEISYASGSATDYVEAWVDSNSYPAFRVLDDTKPFKMIFVEYIGGLYGITQPSDRSASKLYLYGDRGACDANTGALSTLVDATKSWETNEWAGCMVKIVGDSKEEQPWRTVVSNTSDTLTVDSPWITEHTTNTSYIIIGGQWKALQTMDYYCESAVVIGDKIWFAFGSRDFCHYWRGFHESTDDTWDTDYQQGNSMLAKKLIGRMATEYVGENAISGEMYSFYNGLLLYPWLFQQDIPHGDCDATKVIGMLTSNTRPWSDSDIANVEHQTYGVQTMSKVATGFGTGYIAHLKFDQPVDISEASGILLSYQIRYASGGYETAGDIELVLLDADGNDDNYDLTPSQKVSFKGAGWQTEILTLLQHDSATVDVKAITDIKIKLTVDDGAVYFYVYGPIYLCYFASSGSTTELWKNFPAETVCNSMQMYAGGAGQLHEKPWLLCNNGVYYLEEGQIKKIPLGELSELAHPRSGEGSCISGPYIFFNMGEKIERYYAGQLDDIGPDLDYGLPENRRGIPASMATYPGAELAGFDCGASGYSHVMYRRHHGWHELYRSPVAGERVRNVHVFARADKHDEIYISEGSDVLIMPFDLNPETEDSFDFTWHGHIETSRIYATTRETAKFFKALELIQELHEDAATTPLQTFRVWYRTSATSDYTLIDNYLEQSTAHSQERNIGSSYNIGGTWIQFLVEFEAQDTSYTPILTAMVLDATERLIVKNTYTYNLQIREGHDDCLDQSVDTVTGKTKVDQLDTWAAQELPLILSSNSIFEDTRRVFIEPTRSRFTHGGQDGDGHEVRTYQLTLLEV